MQFRSYLCLPAAVASVLLFAPAINAQTLLESLRSTDATAEEIEPTLEESTVEKWSDIPEIKSGFMQGCVGEVDQLTEQQAIVKENYCQCAFEAYSSRYTPQQVLQVNALSSEIGENGLVLVNLMMAPDLNSCADSTNYQF